MAIQLQQAWSGEVFGHSSKRVANGFLVLMLEPLFRCSSLSWLWQNPTPRTCQQHLTLINVLQRRKAPPRLDSWGEPLSQMAEVSRTSGSQEVVYQWVVAGKEPR